MLAMLALRLFLLLAASAALPVHAQNAAQGLLEEQVRQLVGGAAAIGAKTPEHARVEVEVGQLNPRLKLAACNNIQPYLPVGLPMWGRTRVGLRCVDGPVHWNVSLPLIVKVYAKAVVAATALPAGAVLTEKLLTTAEIDIAAEPAAVFTEPGQSVGRILARPLAAGDAVRTNSLQKRQWFASGANVTVETSGKGFSISSEGQALSPGIEGQDVRIRLENGRTVIGRAVDERRVEVLL